MVAFYHLQFYVANATGSSTQTITWSKNVAELLLRFQLPPKTGRSLPGSDFAEGVYAWVSGPAFLRNAGADLYTSTAYGGKIKRDVLSLETREEVPAVYPFI